MSDVQIILNDLENPDDIENLDQLYDIFTTKIYMENRFGLSAADLTRFLFEQGITLKEILDDVRNIYPYMFTNLNEVSGNMILPRHVEYLCKRAFTGSNITSLKCNVTFISPGAFSYNRKLETLEITSKSGLTILRKAFFNCSSLREVTLNVPSLVIHETAFDGCKKLILNIPESCALDRDFNLLNSLVEIKRT